MWLNNKDGKQRGKITARHTKKATIVAFILYATNEYGFPIEGYEVMTGWGYDRTIIMVEMSKSDREKRWVRAIKSNFDESDYTPIRLVVDEERKLSFSEFDDDEDVSKTKIQVAMDIISDKNVPRKMDTERC